MIALYATAAVVLANLSGIMVVLARKLRGVSLSRRIVNLLFPFSQLCLVAFLFCYVVAFELSVWFFVFTAVVGVLCGPVDLILFKALREAEEKDVAEERVRLLEEQLDAQETYYQRLLNDRAEASRVRKEVARELESVEDLLRKSEVDKASDGLAKAVSLMDSATGRFCERQAVDALVTMKAKICEEQGVSTTFNLTVPGNLPFSSVELCAIFSNMLDNALCACGDVDEGDRTIDMTARVDGGIFVVDMRNSCRAAAPNTPREHRSRGKGLAEHGWGLSILEGLADRHDGPLMVEQQDGEYRTTIMLNTAHALSGEPVRR